MRPICCAARGVLFMPRDARLGIEAPLGEPFLADWDTGLACCGDWCLDARIEAAFMSGDRLGEALVARYGG